MTTFNVECLLIPSLPQSANFQASSLPPVLLVPLKRGPLESLSPLPSVTASAVSSAGSWARDVLEPAVWREDDRRSRGDPSAFQSLAPSWDPGVGVGAAWGLGV